MALSISKIEDAIRFLVQTSNRSFVGFRWENMVEDLDKPTADPNTIVCTPVTGVSFGTAWEASVITHYDDYGNANGMLSVLMTGDRKGSFEIIVRPDSYRKGIGTKLLDYAHMQGIDLVSAMHINNFTFEGKMLLLQWLRKKQEPILIIASPPHLSAACLTEFLSLSYAEHRIQKLAEQMIGVPKTSFRKEADLHNLISNMQSPTDSKPFVINARQIHRTVPAATAISNAFMPFKKEPWIDPLAPTVGKRKPLNNKQKGLRKRRNKAARRNRH